MNIVYEGYEFSYSFTNIIERTNQDINKKP